MDPDSAYRRFVLDCAWLMERLRRVNSVLEAWDEYEAVQAMPKELRPKVPRPVVECDILRGMRAKLAGELAELQKIWARRN